MKTKKKGLVAIAVLMTAFAGVSYQTIAAESTTVVVSATVVSNTCAVGDTARGELAPVSVSAFGRTAGRVVGFTTIPVVFSDCGGGTKGVTVTVSGMAAGTGGAFRNENDGRSGGARNVGIYFYESNGTAIIRAGTNVPAYTYTFFSNNTLNYRARYVSLTDNVEPGSVLTTINMNFTYL